MKFSCEIKLIVEGKKIGKPVDPVLKIANIFLPFSKISQGTTCINVEKSAILASVKNFYLKVNEKNRQRFVGIS